MAYFRLGVGGEVVFLELDSMTDDQIEAMYAEYGRIIPYTPVPKMIIGDLSEISDTPPAIAPIEWWDAPGDISDLVHKRVMGKLDPIMGRLLIMQGKRMIVSIGMALTSPEMAKWLHAMTNIYKGGVSVRWIASKAQANMRMHGEPLHGGEIWEKGRESGGVPYNEGNIVEASGSWIVETASDVWNWMEYNLPGGKHFFSRDGQDWKSYFLDKMFSIVP